MVTGNATLFQERLNAEMKAITTKNLNRINIIYPYYDNPNTLAAHLINWWCYPKFMRDRLRFIVVDDCSKKHPAEEIIRTSPLPITLYRIHTDIPWNQHGAKNLAMKEFEDTKDWCLLTDMDIFFPATEIYKMQNMNLNPDYFYRFTRKKLPEYEDKKHHPNTFLVRADKYWKAGGYDEDYCGTYGGDGPFAKALQRHCHLVEVPDIECHYYGRTYIDSGTDDLDRREHMNEAYRKKFEEKRANDDMVPKNHLRFEWLKIERSAWK